MRPELQLAIEYTVTRIDRILATFADEDMQIDARLVLMREDDWVYIEAARIVSARKP